MTQLQKILWEMHKIAFPGEYGLGGQGRDGSDYDKEDWVRMGELINAALVEVHNDD